MRTATQVSYKTTTLTSRGGRVDLLPQALGRDAFWIGRPIWGNPFTDESAREWAAGWNSGLAELRRRCNNEALPDADGSPKWQSLVRGYRR